MFYGLRGELQILGRLAPMEKLWVPAILKTVLVSVGRSNLNVIHGINPSSTMENSLGGMFFAHMALRPAATELLEPSLQLPLLKRTLDHFFVWVKTTVVLILVTGYWLSLVACQGQMGPYVHIMQGTGLLMVGLFLFIYFFPYKRMGRALDRVMSRLPEP